MVKRIRNPRDTEPMPITHPMLAEELAKQRDFALGLFVFLMGFGLMVLWCVA